MIRIPLAFFTAALLFTGCGQDDNSANKDEANTSLAEITTLKSTQTREVPEVNATDLQTLRNGASDFAFDLYRELNATGNLFFSPYSISSAFTMLYAGAAGETRRQIGEVLHFLDDDTRHHKAFNALDAAVFNGEGNLTSANSLWLQQDFPVNPTFLDTLALNYGADVKTVDFVTEPEPARLAINEWVYEHTNRLIPEALGEGAITTQTRFVLANTIHFLENWQDTFAAELTTKDSFYLRDDSNVTVDMMHQAEFHRYYRGSNFSAISKPYDDNKHKMVILLPDTGAFGTVENNLSREALIQAIDAMASKEVILSMPKFEIGTDYLLNTSLQAMGMTDAFDDHADFSALSVMGLVVSKVIHKAVVRVDEEGTEAAAVTVIIGETTAFPSEEERVTMTIDRPFFFFIMDDSDTILFMGKVENPNG